MAKRSATTELNHDNWNEEYEPEECGTFKKATEDKLKNRIIKTARRRNPISSVSNSPDSEKKSVFAGFQGFTKPPVSSNNSFSFLSNLASKSDTPKTNGTSEKTTDNALKKPDSTQPIFSSTNTSKSETSNSNDYYAKLKGLNESVTKWIKTHVDANPLINLQPVFKDYEKYFKDLEKENTSKENNKSEKTTTGFAFKATENTAKPAEENALKFSFGGSTTSTTTTPNFTFGSSTNTFSFGKANNGPTTTTTTTAPNFSFGSTASTAPNTGFSFTKSTSFSFSNVAKPQTEESKEATEENEDEPPKVEFTPVIESDHLYTIRCKVFVKKDGTFGDRGVGNLFLKPIKDSEKVQLIVRADTNLGNLLCNFILSESIPTQRMGKKDVMLVCLPLPDSKPPPVPILLRVKSPEDADQLLETLQKHKK